MEEKRKFYNCAEAETVRVEGADKTRSGEEDKMRSDKLQFLAIFFCISIRMTLFPLFAQFLTLFIINFNNNTSRNDKEQRTIYFM